MMKLNKKKYKNRVFYLFINKKKKYLLKYKFIKEKKIKKKKFIKNQ